MGEAGYEEIVGVDEAASDDEPQGPIFFLSYAHGPRPHQELVESFFTQLSDHVQQLFGLSADLVGFMDQSSLRGGERWSDSLVTAVGTCRVFVPLISRGYVRSEWCAREWHAFHRRTAHTVPPGRNTTPVLPVLWSALARNHMPRAIGDLQLFLPAEREPPDLREQYRHDGLYGFGVTRHDSYATLV
jgi:TIR domain